MPAVQVVRLSCGSLKTVNVLFYEMGVFFVKKTALYCLNLSKGVTQVAITSDKAETNHMAIHKVEAADGGCLLVYLNV